MTIMILFEWRMMGLLKMNGFYFFPAPSKTKTGLETEDILKRPTNRRSKIEAPSGTPGWMTWPGLPKLMLMMFGHSTIFGSTPRSPAKMICQ